MHTRLRDFPCTIALSTLSLLVSGCSLSQFSSAPAASSAAPSISGLVHGGQQPVTGAVIQLYAVNTTANKGASAAQIHSVVTSDGNGNFSLAGDFSCPTPNSLVYLTASGGNPGLAGNVNNSGLSMMTAVGACDTLTASSFITINELTTVAAVEALAPFMADISHVGSDPGNSNGLAGAFSTAAALVNPATGLPATAGSGVIVPVAQLNTLADILSSCVNTNGTDGTCATLFQNATSTTETTTDTLSAILHIVQSPSQNVAALFALINSQAPFEPALTVAPGDWSAATLFPLPDNSPAVEYLMAIDTAQHIWVYTQPLTATNAIAGTGTITVYDTNGNVLFTIQPGVGGLSMPVQIAADPFGNVWALNSTLTFSKFGPNGSALSPSGGFPVPLAPPANSTSSSYFGLKLFSFDPSGNLWAVNSGTTSNCFLEVSNAGAVITPTGNFCNAAGNAATFTVSTDGSGDAWFLGLSSVAKVNTAGSLAATGINSNGCFDLPQGTGTLSTYMAEGVTLNTLYDRTHDQLWGVTEVGAGALHDDGSQVFCHTRGANVPLIPFYNTSTPGNGGTIGFLYMGSAALDGNGTLWFGAAGEMVSVPTSGAGGAINQTTISGLAAINSTGDLVTPFNTATGVYGLSTGSQLLTTTGSNGVPVFTFQTGGFLFSGSVNSGGMAIDSYGNIWGIVYSGYPARYYLAKIPGLAAPKSYQ